MKKTKILMLSDHPLSFSGVGTQSLYLINGLIETGRYSFRCFGGAMKHKNYDTVVVNDDFIIKPTDGFGTPEMLRQVLASEKFDAMILFTDPRFFGWLFDMHDEIHNAGVPILYNTIWDARPTPKFQEHSVYKAVDQLNCISKLTRDMLAEMRPDITNYIPHAVPEETFFPMSEKEKKQYKTQLIGKDKEDYFVGLWVNRNARRKRPNDLLHAWKEFLDRLEEKEGHRKATLILHTQPVDEEGVNLFASAEHFGIIDNIFFSKDFLQYEQMNILHNVADFTINNSFAEGFGMCLSKRNYLTFSNGQVKSIEKAKIDDKILCQDGKFHKILATKTRKEKVIKIKSVGNERLELTKEHPVLVFSNNKKYTSFYMRKSYDFLQENNEENINLIWKKASEVNVGDFLVVPRLKKNGKIPKEIDLLDWVDVNSYYDYDENYIWCKNNNLKENNKINRKIKINNEFLNFIGWYLAEGSCNNQTGLVLDFATKELDIIKILQKKIKNIFNIKISLYEKFKRNSSCRLYKSSKIIGQFMYNFCGSGSRNKFINKILLKEPKKLGPLVNGLFLGDGNKSKYFNQYRLTNTSRHLIYQIKNILSSIGIYSSIFEEDNSKGFGNRNIFKLNVGSIHYNEFCKWTKLEKHTPLINKKIKKERRWIVKENYIFVPVREVSKPSEQEVEVFDIQIEDIKNFVANGVVVHNSTLQSLQCGVPIIAPLTGGQQDQVINPDTGEEYGVAMPIDLRTLVGTPRIPYIYENYVKTEKITDSIWNLYEYGPEKRKEIGQKGREFVLKNFNMKNLINKWDNSIQETIKNWRKRRNIWELKEI